MAYLVLGDTYAATLKVQELQSTNYPIIWLLEGDLEKSSMLLDRLKSLKIRLLSPEKSIVKVYQYYTFMGYNGDINSCYISPPPLTLNDTSPPFLNSMIVKIYPQCTQITISEGSDHKGSDCKGGDCKGSDEAREVTIL